MLTQVELNAGARWMVAFIDAGLATVGTILETDGSLWTITRVYATEPRKYVAWWLRAHKQS